MPVNFLRPDVQFRFGYIHWSDLHLCHHQLLQGKLCSCSSYCCGLHWFPERRKYWMNLSVKKSILFGLFLDIGESLNLGMVWNIQLDSACLLQMIQSPPMCGITGRCSWGSQFQLQALVHYRYSALHKVETDLLELLGLAFVGLQAPSILRFPYFHHFVMTLALSMVLELLLQWC